MSEPTHDHDHDHDHVHADHDVSQHDPEAAERNKVPYYGKRIYAMRELLIAKGVLTREDIQRQIEYMDARSPANGARLVARAWVDPPFKQRLLSDPKAACAEMGIDASEPDRIRGARKHRAGAQPRRVHALLVLPATNPRPSARLVQELRLSLARGGGAAGGDGRVRHRPCRRRSKCACSTARRTCATWCCRCARPARRT